MSQLPHRARFGRRGVLLGLSAALALGRARLALAAAPGEARLVVVILRGGMDGLFAVQPYGDPDLAALRGPLALPEPGQEGGLLDLGGTFGLHPLLAALHGQYQEGQALLLHAVAGPTRSRSHFEAQDMLESGAGERLTSGWLNRALAGLPAGTARTRAGLSVGAGVPLLLRGEVPVGAYLPLAATRPEPDLMARLAALHGQDPLLGPAFAEGLRARGFAMETLGDAAPAARDRGAFPVLAGAAGRLLAAPDGPRVAALETGGWDSHAGQAGLLRGPLRGLDAGIAALRDGLGEAWGRTAVLVMTEFGRTARVNGTNGTDHGSGGVAILTGGAVAGGRVRADWPGLGEGQLFENRDLQPTLDLRAVAKALLRDHLRLPEAAVARAFPGSEAIAPLGGLLRQPA